MIGLQEQRVLMGVILVILVVIGIASVQDLNEQNEQAAQLTRIEHRLDQIQNRMAAIAFGMEEK